MSRRIRDAAFGVIPILVFLVWEWIWMHSSNGVEAVSQPSADTQKQIVSSASDFVKTLFTLNSTLLAAFGAFVWKISETARFSGSGLRLVSSTFALLGTGLWMGYESYAAALKLYSQSGVLNVNSGPFHVASSLQIIALIAGSACYAFLILSILSPDAEAPASKVSAKVPPAKTPPPE